jgi:LuxR family maltose regulon positive regulatory protein
MQRAELCAAGVEAMLSDATFAEAAAPPWLSGPALDDTVLGWRPGALRLLAEAHLLAGDTGQARARFAETSALATEWHHHDAIIASESMLGLLAMDRGDWQQAAGHVNRALATINDQRLQDYPISLLAFAGAARLAVHHGDLSEAHRQLTQAMRARPAATYILPYVAVRLRLQLAKVHRAIGDLATARQLLHEIDDILTHRPALGTLTHEVEQLRHILTSSPGEQASTMPLTAAELRLLPYLQTHLTASGIAQRLFVSQHTVKSQMKSIYRKLGVTTRRDVVEKATTVGLLGA